MYTNHWTADLHVLYMCIPFAIVHSSGRTGSIDHNDHLIYITLQLCPEGEREGRGGEGGREGGREKEGRRKKKSIHIHTKNNSNLHNAHVQILTIIPRCTASTANCASSSLILLASLTALAPLALPILPRHTRATSSLCVFTDIIASVSHTPLL